MSDETISDEALRHIKVTDLEDAIRDLDREIEEIEGKIGEAEKLVAGGAAAAAAAGVGAGVAAKAAAELPSLRRALAKNQATVASIRAKLERRLRLPDPPERPPGPGSGGSGDQGSDHRSTPAKRTPAWPSDDEPPRTPPGPEPSGKQSTPGVLKPRTREEEERVARQIQASIDAAHSRTFGARFRRFMNWLDQRTQETFRAAMEEDRRNRNQPPDGRRGDDSSSKSDE